MTAGFVKPTRYFLCCFACWVTRGASIGKEGISNSSCFEISIRMRSNIVANHVPAVRCGEGRKKTDLIRYPSCVCVCVRVSLERSLSVSVRSFMATREDSHERHRDFFFYFMDYLILSYLYVL